MVGTKKSDKTSMEQPIGKEVFYASNENKKVKEKVCI